MRATEQFIEDAIEGGYSLAKIGFSRRKIKSEKYQFEDNKGLMWVGCEVLEIESGEYKIGQFRVNIEKYLLDPKAWEAVGKTRGWNEKMNNNLLDWKEKDTITLYMTDFIIDIADGKSIEEALGAISK